MITLKKVGNSRGVILPKRLIEKYGLDNKLNLIETDEGILIKKADNPREGWAEAFQAAVDKGEFDMLMPDYLDDDMAEGY